MADKEKDLLKGWKVNAVGVTFKNGQRIERPLEDFTPEELREISDRRTEDALRAAGYVPVEHKIAAAI